jgi:hypothetical protein
VRGLDKLALAHEVGHLEFAHPKDAKGGSRANRVTGDMI